MRTSYIRRFQIKPNKIHIIGGPGSGKSYAANRLAQMLDIPVFDLDQLFWDLSSARYGTRTSEDVRDNKLREIFQKDKWIIEGVYYSWLYDSFAQADMIIILNPNPFLRTWRILKRFIKRKL